MKQPYITVLTVLATLFFFNGCERSPSASSTGFHLEVREVTIGTENRAVLLLIHTKSPGSISVDGETKHSSTILYENDGVYEGSVALLATRFAPSGDSHAYIQVLSRPQTPNGSYAGGPSVYTLPPETQLEDFFIVTARSGEYALNTPVEIAQEQGNPITLTIGDSTK